MSPGEKTKTSAIDAPASDVLPQDSVAKTLRKWVVLMLLVLPVFVLLIIRGGNLTLLFQAYTRSTFVVFVGVTVTSLFRPKWCLPAFIALAGPLQVFSFRDFGSMGGVPIYVSSMAVVGLALFWSVRGASVYSRKRVSVPWLLVVSGWMIAIVIGSLALGQDPGPDGDGIATKIIFFKGLIESLLLCVVAHRWIKCYGDVTPLVWAFALSVILAIISGLTTYAMLMQHGGNSDVGTFRFYVTAYGGPNFTGFVLILIYPFILWLADKKNRLLTFILGLMLIGVSFVTLSRSTPICILLETVACAILLRKKTVPMMLLVSLPVLAAAAVPFVPQDMKDYWQARWEATDHMGLLLGKAEKLETADVIRVDMKNLFRSEMLKRPWGGFGATGALDPENIYLDTAAQLGWGPAIWFIAIQCAIAVIAFIRLIRFFNGRDALGGVIFVAALAEIGYTVIVGLNLAKITISQGGTESTVSIGANNIPILFFAIFLAICFSPNPTDSGISERRPETDSNPRKRRFGRKPKPEPSVETPETIPAQA